jgi:hypothetical protein
MHYLFAMIVIFAAIPSAFAERICTRDFASDGMDICRRGGSPRHQYVRSALNHAQTICVMTYEDKYCKFQKAEFAHATTLAGKIVCVLNYNQPDVTGNYCSHDGKHYKYVLDPWDN